MKITVRIALLVTAFFAVLLCSVGCNSDTTETQSIASNVHEHVWTPSDCENPQKCSCGATKGSPVGHSWLAATCTTPKICLACEKTEGEALGHKFIAGLCEVCGEINPDEIVDSPKVWISKDNLYHGNRICSNPPNDPNQESTLAKAREAGVHPCPRCYTAN